MNRNRQHKAPGGKRKVASKKAGASSTSAVRIIGGRWRGSKLSIADLPALRPTGDRVRETLFNWLAPMINGARVLDLFAGTGALGLEAASRGAQSVVLIEEDRKAAALLTETANRLVGGAEAELESAASVQVFNIDVLEWLRKAPEERFDLVMVDPPFAADLYQASFEHLVGWLKPNALIYVESPSDQPSPVSPVSWSLFREKTVGQVRLQLLRSSVVPV